MVASAILLSKHRSLSEGPTITPVTQSQSDSHRPNHRLNSTLPTSTTDRVGDTLNQSIATVQNVYINCLEMFGANNGANGALNSATPTTSSSPLNHMPTEDDRQPMPATGTASSEAHSVE